MFLVPLSILPFGVFLTDSRSISEYILVSHDGIVAIFARFKPNATVVKLSYLCHYSIIKPHEWTKNSRNSTNPKIYQFVGVRVVV